jgi:hypothetical protein
MRARRSAGPVSFSNPARGHGVVQLLSGRTQGAAFAERDPAAPLQHRQPRATFVALAEGVGIRSVSTRQDGTSDQGTSGREATKR